MTIVKQELRRGRLQLMIWTASVGALLAVCVKQAEQITATQVIMMLWQG